MGYHTKRMRTTFCWEITYIAGLKCIYFNIYFKGKNTHKHLGKQKLEKMRQGERERDTISVFTPSQIATTEKLDYIEVNSLSPHWYFPLWLETQTIEQWFPPFRENIIGTLNERWIWHLNHEYWFNMYLNQHLNVVQNRHLCFIHSGLYHVANTTVAFHMWYLALLCSCILFSNILFINLNALRMN